jgi:hypothetical protein
VGVGAHQRIRIGLRQIAGPGVGILIRGEDHPGQVLEVDLMHDAGIGWNDPEVVEGALSPSEELVPLAVALVVEIHIGEERHRRAEGVHLDRMIDHQLDGLQRIDPAGIAAELGHGIAHGCEVDHRRDSGKVLEQNPGGGEGDLTRGRVPGRPAGQSFNVLRRDRYAVLGAQQVFEKDPKGIGEAGDVDLSRGQGIESEDLEAAPTHLEGGPRAKGVAHGCKVSSLSYSGMPTDAATTLPKPPTVDIQAQ